MDGWLIGLIAICVLGVGAILFGALHDRARHRREVAALTSAPARSIPSFAGGGATPQYLSELQARRAPAGAGRAALDAIDRASVRDELAAEDTVRIPIGFASRDFVTDPDSGWAVLDEPRVLACAEPITSIRELLGLLERSVLSGTPLVIVAPAIDRQVLETLEVNRIQRKLKIVVVLSTDPKPVDAVCAATRATLIGRAELQAGDVTGAELGACRRWVSSVKDSRLIGPVGRLGSGLASGLGSGSGSGSDTVS